MTLFVNASTLALVTSRLGLDQLSPADLALRERIVAGSIERVRHVVRNIASDRALEPDALAAVEATLGEQRREAEARLSWQARHDSLTGLVNRAEFERRIDSILPVGPGSNEQHAFAGCGAFDRFIGRKGKLTHGCARRCRQARR